MDPDRETRRQMGVRLQMMREFHGKTQPELAEIAGVTSSAVAAWEQGRNQIDVIKLARMVDACQFSADYILRGRFDGMEFSVAHKFQQFLRIRQNTEPAKRGRPRRISTAPRLVDVGNGRRPAALHEPPAETFPMAPCPKRDPDQG